MSTNSIPSSYLRYLPPILWEGDSPLLGQMLRVFEKILTGIDDGLILQHDDHTHQAVEQVIAHLDQLFDPWHTPPQFLDWLASWVDLSFPTIRDTQQNITIQVWDEYLRRKAISQIAQIYHKRGLKEGLNQYLNLYTLAEKRPRIAVDNGSRILFTRPRPGRFTQMATLISQGPYAIGTTLTIDGLVFPSCIALAPDGSLIVGDTGIPNTINWGGPVINGGLWRTFPSGQYMSDTVVGKPRRIGPVSFARPTAVATDNASTNWQIYVLDNPTTAGNNALSQISSSDFTTTTSLATKTQLGFSNPVAMVFTNGHLLILDRGALFGIPAIPRIIDVQLSPFVINAPRNLTQVIEPLSLAVLSNGNLLIGDGRQQDQALPANIVLVNRSNASSWVETLQLDTTSTVLNPLVAPVGITCTDDTHIFVLDLGLKPAVSQSSTPSVRTMAEAASIYSVDLQQKIVTRAAEQGALVHPMGMVQDTQGTLYIADRGEYSDPSSAGPMMRVWRGKPNEFGVAVHFSSQRLPTVSDQRRIYQNISDIVNQEKPAHTIWTMLYGTP